MAQGRRATLIDWCKALPPDQLDGWICYWLGVANMADDAAAESWFARAWASFAERGELDGQCLTAARAVLSKSDSWRTHEGLAAWTQRVIDVIDRDFPKLARGDQLLAWTGMLRAVDFAQDYRATRPRSPTDASACWSGSPCARRATPSNLRLMASLDAHRSRRLDRRGGALRTRRRQRGRRPAASDLSSWVLGSWLVTFGSVTSRYFTYAKRGFPYASPEDALRAAVAIGEREGLRGVEFGALYHLQLLMKLRNDWSEFATLIARIAEISDSRYTTQVAVAADCEAALHTRQKRFAAARAACDRFMTAIEAANEPPIERWPHFITKFQVLLAAEMPRRGRRIPRRR